MRSEQEMLQLILDFTGRDENICAVLLNGSRANPNAPGTHSRLRYLVPCRLYFPGTCQILLPSPIWRNL
jgi:hypothetical protein